ncbi:unnamed protein product, partial [Ectocarpus fasciculatus]
LNTTTKKQTNFRRDFVATEGFRRILDASKQEQRELRLLRAGGMLPLGTHSPGSSSENKTPSSASPHTAAAMRDDEGRKVPPPPPPRSPLIPG